MSVCCSSGAPHAPVIGQGDTPQYRAGVTVCLYVVVPGRPMPPSLGKVTHHSIELEWQWDDDQDMGSIGSGITSESRVSARVQSQDKNGGWSNVYM